MSDDTRRLLAAIYPPRRERVLMWLVGRCYHRAETGPIGWLGDRADDLRVWSLRRRASGGSS
jgi:hypothetical protein